MGVNAVTPMGAAGGLGGGGGGPRPSPTATLMAALGGGGGAGGMMGGGDMAAQAAQWRAKHDEVGALPRDFRNWRWNWQLLEGPIVCSSNGMPGLGSSWVPTTFLFAGCRPAPRAGGWPAAGGGGRAATGQGGGAGAAAAGRGGLPAGGAQEGESEAGHTPRRAIYGALSAIVATSSRPQRRGECDGMGCNWHTQHALAGSSKTSYARSCSMPRPVTSIRRYRPSSARPASVVPLRRRRPRQPRCRSSWSAQWSSGGGTWRVRRRQGGRRRRGAGPRSGRPMRPRCGGIRKWIGALG